ncbi:hypothetical protein OA086_03080 [Candidatus Pelagibacter sp.]|nr:hypothetical protein [Candidatus Pelagibacter sp.]
MNLKFSHYPYISTFLHSTTTVPQQWIKDIKYVEFNELLASSVGALALVFNWNKANKNEFTEIASGMLSSSYIYGEPISALSSIVALAYSYTKTKNKDSLRKFKWAAIRGATGVAAFALSTKLISITVLNVLIGICAAAVVRKTVGILRLYEYRHILKNLRKLIPTLKKEMTRREFISLKMFTYKNA